MKVILLESMENLGRVGEVVSVNTDFLHLLADHGSMPVIAPVGVDENGIVHNVNADTAAAAVAAFLRAQRMRLMGLKKPIDGFRRAAEKNVDIIVPCRPRFP